MACDFAFTYNGLFRYLCELFGSDAYPEYVPVDDFEKSYPQRTSRHHVLYHQLLSNEKARRVLGFVPQTDPHEALRDNFKFLVSQGRLQARVH